MAKIPKLDIEESRRLGTVIHAKPGLCFENAVRVLISVPEYAQAIYVEGLTADAGEVRPHGWVVAGNKLLDPTWTLPGYAASDNFPDGVKYWRRAARNANRAAVRQIEQRRRTPLL